jgi:threonine dehydrogenase-like Zn-dependent dehydrogenase
LLIKKAILYGAGDLRLDEEPFDPSSLQAHEVLVRTIATGFSTGTDLANYQGRSTEVPGAPDYPRPVGYSNVGVVDIAGKAVTSLCPGDRVFSIKAHRSAFAALETDLLIPLPAAVDAEQASLGYLVHLGMASLRQVRYEAGESVCVVGLGVIGLCTVAVARAMGARVIALANDERRAALARQMGALEAYVNTSFDASAIFDRQGADIAVLTANTWDAYRQSLELVRYGGRITVLGFPGRAQPAPDFNPLDARWLYGKQLTIAGAGHLPRVDCSPFDIRFNLRRDLAYVFDLMASGDLPLGPVISHRFPYDRMREAYELANQHSKQLSAAVFDWRAAHEDRPVR